MDKLTLYLTYDDRSPNGRYVIGRVKDTYMEDATPLFERECIKGEDEGLCPPPPDVAAEYERLTGKAEFSHQPPHLNLVAMIATADGGDCAFDQPCRFGYRVEGHAVYCKNDGWLYAPGKCRRTWYTGGRVRDEDCRGFQPHDKEPRP